MKNNKLTKQDPEENWKKAKEIEFGKKEIIKTSSGKEMILDRGGIDDKKLAEILQSDASDDAKNAMAIQYVASKDKDALAMMGEMFRSRGYAVKEMRQFKSQMRFDFEMFVNTYCVFLKDTADNIWKQLEFKENIEDVLESYKKDKELSIGITANERGFAILALSYYEQAKSLQKVVQEITNQREKAMGKNIYVDKLGRVHSLYEEDIFDIVKKEKEELMKMAEEENKKKK